MKYIEVKELRHAILRALKEKLLNGQPAELTAEELVTTCERAAVQIPHSFNPHIQKTLFADACVKNLDFLTSIDLVGVRHDGEEALRSVFLTDKGRGYVDGVEFTTWKGFPF
jgi:hypothetical protein